NQVAHDVQEGMVSEQEASRLYGVILKGGSVDRSQTDQRRAAMRAERVARHMKAPLQELSDDDPAGSIVINEYLRIDNRRIVCRRCGRDHCAETENYKSALLLKTVPLTSLSPVNRDPAEYIDETIEFRLFICPGCGTQVETEIALAKEPPLW